MKTIEVNGNVGGYIIHLPESLDEIKADYLKSCTDFVNPAPNYAVVAIVYKDSLSLVLTSAKKNKPANVNIIPVFVKAGETDSQFISSINCGDRIVVSGSALSLAHHINSPYNKITPNNIISLCEGDKDIYATALKMRNPICFIEFKLIAVNEIHAKLDTTKNSFINPFVFANLPDAGN